MCLAGEGMFAHVGYAGAQRALLDELPPRPHYMSFIEANYASRKGASGPGATPSRTPGCRTLVGAPPLGNMAARHVSRRPGQFALPTRSRLG